MQSGYFLCSRELCIQPTNGGGVDSLSLWETWIITVSIATSLFRVDGNTNVALLLCRCRRVCRGNRMKGPRPGTRSVAKPPTKSCRQNKGDQKHIDTTRCPLKNAAWSDNGTKKRAGQTGELTVPGQYTILAPNINQWRRRRKRRKSGNTGQRWAVGRSVGRVYEKLAVWRDLCCAGTISAPHKKIHFSSRAKCIGKARTSTSESEYEDKVVG